MALPKKNNLNNNSLPSIEEIKLPDIEDVEFKTLSLDEQELLDEKDNQNYKTFLPPEEDYIEESLEEGREDEPFYEEKKEDSLGDMNIDKEKKKILPFGRKKKSKVNDKRKDILKTTKIFRTFTAIIIGGFFILGLKNTFLPSNSYSPDDISNMVNETVGITGFPLEQGKQFVENFIDQLMITDRTDKAENARLAKFLEPEKLKNKRVDSVRSSFMDIPSGNKQRISTPAKVYKQEAIFDYLGRYEVTVQVTDSDGKDTVKTENDGSANKGHWITFSLNVYYDHESKTMSIIEESISLLPSYVINDPKEIPEAKPIGNGEINRAMTETLTPTIDGYIQAFANSSWENYNDILQYIPANPKPELFYGFNGKVSLADTVDSSISKSVYNTDNPNEWKVLVKVLWKDTSSTENQVVYKSTYVMTINKYEENQKYLVTKFQPYTYIKADKI